MAPKLDKKWQAQLDSMEKQITDTIEKRITENSQVLTNKMLENINRTNEKLVDDIKQLVVAELKDIRQDTGEIKVEMKDTEEKMKEIDDKVKNLESQMLKMKREGKGRIEI